MNTLVIAFFAVVAVVAAAPAAVPVPEEPIAILRQAAEVNPDGSYTSSFETANGITIDEEGSSKVEGKDVIQTARGSSAYTAPDGTLVETKWYADETGFHAEGTHIPVEQPLPLWIVKSLEWSAAHPEEEAEELAKKV